MLCCAHSSLLPEAQVWAERLHLPLEAQPPARGYYLLYSDQGLALVNADQPQVQPVSVDFVQGASAHRRLYGGGSGQALAKACGLKPGIRPRILDATLGLAGDAFVLACLGCEVLGIERHPWVLALTQDAWRRAQTDTELSVIVARLQFKAGDATRDLASLSADFNPQVVYLDPMFPHTKKQAQVKKEMQFFRELVGQDADADGLLDQALALASHRVVVKRPRKAPHLAGREPGLVLAGKANRFDIYPLKSLTK